MGLEKYTFKQALPFLYMKGLIMLKSFAMFVFLFYLKYQRFNTYVSFRVFEVKYYSPIGMSCTIKCTTYNIYDTTTIFKLMPFNLFIIGHKNL